MRRGGGSRKEGEEGGAGRRVRRGGAGRRGKRGKEEEKVCSVTDLLIFLFLSTLHGVTSRTIRTWREGGGRGKGGRRKGGGKEGGGRKAGGRRIQ